MLCIPPLCSKAFWAGCKIPFAGQITTHLAPLHSFVAPSFQSGSVHPLPILFCSPAGHRLRSGVLLARSQAHVNMPHKTPSLCAHHSLSAILLVAPVAGTRRPPPFIRASFSPAAVKRLAIFVLKYFACH